MSPPPLHRAKQQSSGSFHLASSQRWGSISSQGRDFIAGQLYGVPALDPVIFAVVGAAGMAQEGGGEGAVPFLVGLGFCLGAPLVYGAISFVMGLLYAVVLNFVFKYTGGLELEIQS